MKYKVIALSVHSALRQKIYHAGDIVSDTDFPPKQAALMEKRGFLEPVAAANAKAAPVKDAAPAGDQPKQPEAKQSAPAPEGKKKAANAKAAK